MSWEQAFNSSGFSPTAFGTTRICRWRRGYAKQLGISHGRINLDEMYRAVLPDAFNLIMDNKGEYMAGQCHNNFMPLVRCAWRCEMKAIAFGFASHNDTWGADYTAHWNAFTIPGDGYPIAKGNLLVPTLVPALVDILVAAGLPVPDATVLAQGLAPTLGHDLAETAVDILVKRTQDPDVGSEILRAAQRRPAEVPLQLAVVYAPGLAPTPHISILEAGRFIIGAERNIRNQKIQYGQFLSLPEPQAIEALAAMNALIAEGFLEAYAGPDVHVYVDPGVVAGFIGQAIALVQTDYANELSQTLEYLCREMQRRGIQTCRPFGKKGETVDNSTQSPGEFSLGENFPKSFNPSTTISFRLPSTAAVSLDMLWGISN